MAFLTAFVESFFFNPDSRTYWHPNHYGLKSEAFMCETKDGVHLSGIVIPAQGKTVTSTRGTVLFFHAGTMNREFHLVQPIFLAEAGFNVVLFDYSGFGESTGKAALENLLPDSEAVLSFLDSSPWKSGKYVFFAQGEGCDAALQLADKYPDKPAALILESCYATRRGWVKDRWGPLIGHFAASQIACKATEPAEVLSRVKAPLLLIFPGNDTFVHSSERKAVIAAAGSKAEVWNVPKARFLGIFGGQRSDWHTALIRFAGEAVEPKKKGKK